MATPPLMKMPTEIVSNITSHLSIRELTRFRVVSRWTENETLRDFADRGFGSLRLWSVNFPKIARLTRVVVDRPRLASAVRTLDVRFEMLKDNTRGLALKVMNPKPRNRGHAPAGPEEQPTIWQLAKKLPKLEALRLDRLDGAGLASYMLPLASSGGDALSSPWYGLKQLRIEQSRLNGMEWQSLLLAGPILRTLYLKEVHCISGWTTILSDIKHSLTGLQTLMLVDLMVPMEPPGSRWHALDVYLYLASGSNSHKGVFEAFGSEEVVVLRSRWASMKGPQAVKSGLGRILEYLEAKSGDE
ncbi:hypothetical protein LTR97_007460 [Elasticomyces elasticus]|uniref:F-box domain-containing protein n=1 Tax=Elasticomyces elasticus TaxID=574655 RepID=A0AAN7ZZY8_9PEZI|nr:hypothetical protein LTR97_007460 [Elasticomyces elasticus]